MVWMINPKIHLGTLGNYEDGFGNKITVKAIANPYDIDRKPDRIFDKAPGYSIITFDITNRSMKLAVWPCCRALDSAPC